MKMSDFTRGPMKATGVLIADIMVGPKASQLAFFVVEGKPSYNVLLGRDWFHPSVRVPSILHQVLLFLGSDKIEVFLAY